MNTELVIRKMMPEDAGKVAQLEAACFTKPWSEQEFSKLAKEKTVCYMTAWDGEHLVGNCGVREIAGEGEITNVAVDPAYRGKKIAGMLMEQLLKEGEALGVKEFTLEVRDSNVAAIRLYESFGFICEGVRKRFYEDPVEDARIYWLRPERI